MTKINPLIQWWVTLKLPAEDVFAKHNFLSQWIIHPVRRRLAKWYLKILRRLTPIKIIAVTGSAGKSTTVQMIASILKSVGKTVATPPSIDPVYNVPNTILKVPYGTRYLVLEYSVEYPGEMDFYLWLAKPDIGVITNIFPTHIEFMGDIEGVFREKSKLVYSLPRSGIAILNSGDPKLKSLSGKLKSKIVWFDSNINPLKQNENTARATARVLGASEEVIKKGLEEYRTPPHRLTIIRHKSGAVILDDSYNSNPWAALSTLEYFNRLAKGKKIAVLGDMLEMGSYDEAAHRELGRAVAKSGFEAVIGVGKSSKFLIDEVEKASKNTKTFLFPTAQDSLTTVKSFLTAGSYLLFKGSRSIGLDRLIEKLT